MSKPTLKVTSDFTETFNKTIKKFKDDAVLIGIPETDTTRKPKKGESEQITNASILALNNFGSPPNHIPAWPVLEIGIKNAKEDIAAQFKLAVVNSLKKGFSALTTYYNRAGIIASTSCKKVINDQDGAPDLADSTLKARTYRGFKGTSRLIVTGQTRNAITYVVKGDE